VSCYNLVPSACAPKLTIALFGAGERPDVSDGLGERVQRLLVEMDAQQLAADSVTNELTALGWVDD